ncbi:MFS transporter [Actinacidiphila bryophytorum]|uniref:Major Facilitator Superfamily protein n=1 Tax=Actinacidiphila bryophytorum TaxID=1436133 RepID=A0A9W4GYR0_9ACTN|nr:MFS transporter [Actinacidiphila bryophytorum]MBM9439316.1 MFS transporter [Actinacidiphila bryophytorum]MBN6546361.1 MFS transporter [Actinacidiphila bryophytorum]CAG7619068.1 Major Facilitator Superfamily protein [Actinacidiphila bryophytorum]
MDAQAIPSTAAPDTAVPDHPGDRSAGAGAALLAVGLGTLLTLMAFTAPATTLAATAHGLHSGAVAQTWMLTGTPVGLAALLLTMGSVADARGRRRTFAAGAVLLLFATALSAAAPGTALFLAGRIAQGVASAAVLAAGLGLIADTHPAGRHRVRALGVWGATVGGGIAVGPVYAAVMAQLWGWRSLYWGLALLAVPVAALSAAVPESRAAHPRRLDLAGALTLGAGTAALVAGFGESRSGWLRPAVLVPLAAAALVLALFAAVERRVAEPMLDPALWRNPTFLAGGVGALTTGLAVVGLFSYLPTMVQGVLGTGAIATSLLFVVWSGVSAVFALLSRRLAPHMGADTQAALGLGISAVGQAAMYGMHVGGSYGRLFPGLAVAGVGSGILNAALARLAVAGVPTERSAMGSGANNTARYVGSALGVALTVSVVTAAHGPSPATALAAGANHAFLLSAATCLAGTTAILLLPRLTPRR